MILLELGFEYDTTSRVLVTERLGTRDLRVMGISTPAVRAYGSDGGMVREFHIHAPTSVFTDDLQDFRTNLSMAYRVATQGGSLDPEWATWLDRINPYKETSDSWRQPTVAVGTSFRFYHPDGPEGNWVWKDTVKTVAAIIKP
jgi:hypothetical protein